MKFKSTILACALSVGLIAGIILSSSNKTYAATPPYQATCTFHNVPSVLPIGSSMHPRVTIKNTGLNNIQPAMFSFVDTVNTTTYFTEKYSRVITPNHTWTLQLNTYTAFAGFVHHGPAQIFSHSDLNYPGSKVYFECSKSFTIV